MWFISVVILNITITFLIQCPEIYRRDVLIINQYLTYIGQCEKIKNIVQLNEYRKEIFKSKFCKAQAKKCLSALLHTDSDAVSFCSILRFQNMFLNFW